MGAWMALLVSFTALAGELEFGYSPSLGPGEKPMLSVTVPRAAASLWIEVEAGDITVDFTRADMGAGETAKFYWPRDPSVIEALATIRVEFTDGYVEAVQVPVSYSYAGQLEVDLARARADLVNNTVTVAVSTKVDRADITAYGEHRRILDKRTVPIDGGPGEISLPWVGAPSDVVLLDVTVHSKNAWAGFTYSPWFVNIPHDDVVFQSGLWSIDASEEPKLQALLRDVADLVDKYGDVVPVKLYIGGCTDTVGDRVSNATLSRNRAQAIGQWLRSSGLNIPIFFSGFGESWLAVQTGDGVDNPLNRRAVYMLGANPPPSSAGVPQTRWSAL